MLGLALVLISVVDVALHWGALGGEASSSGAAGGRRQLWARALSAASAAVGSSSSECSGVGLHSSALLHLPLCYAGGQ